MATKATPRRKQPNPAAKALIHHTYNYAPKRVPSGKAYRRHDKHKDNTNGNL